MCKINGVVERNVWCSKMSKINGVVERNVQIKWCGGSK